MRSNFFFDEKTSNIANT